MLLKSYSKEIFRPECNPGFESVHCIAHLNQNIESALPYLNAVLGGFEYLNDPPAVIFRSQGKLITVHGTKIAINALRDEAEADRILEWLKREINEAWADRENIQPSCEGIPKPKLIEILKLLPKTNCKECGEATCMVFAARVAEGVKGPADCPPINSDNMQILEEYMGQFKIDV
ncbi:MAG: Fe-S cluster protein [Desulfobacterales bacterium]|nr:Fe-S cluster protein [Desulfobacterales bacterium]